MRSSVAVALVVLAVLASAGGAEATRSRASALLAPSGRCGAVDDRAGLGRAAAEQVMLCLTNYARARAGLRPLRLDPDLNAAGDAKLRADVACKVFSHTPCGRPFENVFATYLRGAAGYRIGENIAWGTGSYGTARAIMDAWLHSPHHLENILTPGYTELGIGYLPHEAFEGYGDTALWSQQFGSRTPAR